MRGLDAGHEKTPSSIIPVKRGGCPLNSRSSESQHVLGDVGHRPRVSLARERPANILAVSGRPDHRHQQRMAAESANGWALAKQTQGDFFFGRSGPRSIGCTSHRRFGPTPAKPSCCYRSKQVFFFRHGTAQPGVMGFELPVGSESVHFTRLDTYVQLVQFCCAASWSIWSLAAGQPVSGDGMGRRRLHRSRLGVKVECLAARVHWMAQVRAVVVILQQLAPPRSGRRPRKSRSRCSR